MLDVLKGSYLAVSVTYAENFLRLFYGLFVIFVAKENLDAVEFSFFGLYFSVATILYGFSKFSLDSFAIKKIVGFQYSKGRLIRNFVFFRFGVCFLFLVIFLSLLYWMDKIYGWYFLLLLLQLIRSFDSVEWYLRAEGKVITQAGSRIFSMLVVLFVLSFFYFLDFDLSHLQFIYVLSLEWLFLSTVYIFLMPKDGKSDIAKVNDEFVEVVRDSLPVYVAYALFLVYSKLDQIVMESLVSTYEYGYYIVAARINETAVILIGSINLVVFPRLVSLYRDDDRLFRVYIRKVSQLFFSMSLVIISMIWLARFFYDFMPEVIKALVEIEIIETLSVMIFSIIPVYAFGLRSSFFAITSQPKEILHGGVLGALVAFLCGVPLMIKLGVLGGVLSIILSSLSALFFSNFFTGGGRDYLRTVIGLR